MSRFTAATGLVLLVTTALVGCTPAAEPEPEWTEESAYAAAEETYSSYFEASRFDSTDGGAISFVTGQLYDVQQKSDEKYAAHTIEVRGETYVMSFTPQSFRLVSNDAVVKAEACVNQETLELNVDGQGWMKPNQSEIYAVELTFVSVAGEMKISDLELGSSSQC